MRVTLRFNFNSCTRCVHYTGIIDIISQRLNDIIDGMIMSDVCHWLGPLVVTILNVYSFPVVWGAFSGVRGY